MPNPGGDPGPAPSPEECNGIDDDQDGSTDEGLAAPPATLMSGVCVGNLQVCAGEAGWEEPDLGDNVDYEGEETRCDGLDNDCDGTTDEELDMVCGTITGECELGVARCIDGVYQDCAGAIAPAPEVCDGLDNDCNDEIDNGINCNCSNGQVQGCGTDVGACRSGQQTCLNGQWGPCQGNTAPSAEVCNDIDDDCNGEVDDNLPATPTACGVGECSAEGISTCQRGQFVDSCTPLRGGAEICDGRDNDCDGNIDNGNPGAGQGCNTEVPGICGPGTTSCVNGVTRCNGDQAAGAPVCGDQQDNDCDGDADEWRNNCDTCGDRYEGSSCATPQSFRWPARGQLIINGTIDIAGDADYYSVVLTDNLAIPNQSAAMSLSNNLPFGRNGFSYQVDVYQSQANCESDDPVATATVGPSMSNAAILSEGINDNFARAINDSGTYIIKVTGEGSNCSVEYTLQPSDF